MNKIYRHYGQGSMIPELFEPIKNDQRVLIRNKPAGGLWASPVDDKASKWEDFLKQEMGMDVADYFDFSIKDDAKVLYISCPDDLQELPTADDVVNLITHAPCLDFEELAKEYDAIFVNLSQGYGIRGVFDAWDVDSLVVFNKDIIQVERSFVRYPDAYQQLSDFLGIDKTYFQTIDNEISYNDGAFHFKIAKVDEQGHITEKTNRLSCQEEFAGIGEIKRQIRERKASESMEKLRQAFSINSDCSRYVFDFNINAHIDGRKEITVEHGLQPEIARLKSDGTIEYQMDAMEAKKAILHHEIEKLKRMEESLRSPRDLLSIPYKSMFKNDEITSVNFGAFLGLLVRESKMERFPTDDERIRNLNINEIVSTGENITRAIWKHNRENRETQNFDDISLTELEFNR